MSYEQRQRDQRMRRRQNNLSMLMQGLQMLGQGINSYQRQQAQQGALAAEQDFQQKRLGLEERKLQSLERDREQERMDRIWDQELASSRLEFEKKEAERKHRSDRADRNLKWQEGRRREEQDAIDMLLKMRGQDKQVETAQVYADSREGRSVPQWKAEALGEAAALGVDPNDPKALQEAIARIEQGLPKEDFNTIEAIRDGRSKMGRLKSLVGALQSDRPQPTGNPGDASAAPTNAPQAMDPAQAGRAMASRGIQQQMLDMYHRFIGGGDQGAWFQLNEMFGGSLASPPIDALPGMQQVPRRQVGPMGTSTDPRSIR